MDDTSFRGDCARCTGLCCVALAFDRGPHFAFDKPAGIACRHLGRDHRCAIHAGRRNAGFSGCESYDCRGAGQLTASLFGGFWAESAAALRVQMRVFWILRQVQDLRHAARQAGVALPAGFEPRSDWTVSTVLLLDLSQLRQAVSSAVSGISRR